MSFYRNTRSEIRTIDSRTLLHDELSLDTIYRIVFDENFDMTFKAREREEYSGHKCDRCCFSGTCTASPYYKIQLKCNPSNREDKRDIFFERFDLMD